MTWKDLVYQQVVAYCNANGSRTFSLGSFFDANVDPFAKAYPGNRHLRQKVCEMLQKLRDEGLISFLGNTGNYTLRGVELLDAEKAELDTLDISHEPPRRKEYLVETYVRNVRWARRAREVLGCYCMFDACKNTFKREDGSSYIEVHHIIPLFEGGEDSLVNLSVLCAHHHKMAHFASNQIVHEVEAMLLDRTHAFLTAHPC